MRTRVPASSAGCWAPSMPAVRTARATVDPMILCMTSLHGEIVKAEHRTGGARGSQERSQERESHADRARSSSADDAEWRGGLPASAREIGHVDRPAPGRDGPLGQGCDHAPGGRVVDVLVGRLAAAQALDEAEVLQEIHSAM